MASHTPLRQDESRGQSEPRAAYIHVPFCAHRCGYCNFTLVAGRDELIAPYLSALAIELEQLSQPRPVQTLYLGGGTPSHLQGEDLNSLLSLVTKWHPHDPGGEFTLEANPGDVTPALIDSLTRFGVRRISLGVQSFSGSKLTLLERDHRADEVFAAVERCRQADLRVALDLIFAAPGESLTNWQRDLETAVALKPEHISTYGLTFEQGTLFWNRRMHGSLTEVDEERQRQMYALAIDLLSANGYQHYEVSNFALPGQRSRHNQIYWSGAPYYAAGPGAARYIDDVREINHRSVTTWIKKVLAHQSPVAEREWLPAGERARELLVIGLRRLDGVERNDFLERTGYRIEDLVGRTLGGLCDLGLLADDGATIRLTREGLYVSDAIWSKLLAESIPDNDIRS